MRHTLDPVSIGPVDVTVIGFVGDQFNGEIAPILADLEANGTVRIIDLAFVRKSADGDTEWVEVEDADIAAFADLDDPEQDLLNDIDLQLIAESLEPATAAMVVVWEHAWAAELSGAIRRAGGAVMTQDRVPHDVVLTAIRSSSGLTHSAPSRPHRVHRAP